MKTLLFIGVMSMTVLFASCNGGQKESKRSEEPFKFKTEQFADAKILRYQVPGFEYLSLNQKRLIYYMSQAALSGRDITWDQNYSNNLLVRATLESIFRNFQGDRNTEDFGKFTTYLKQVWFHNGIHHHYSTDKFFPDFTERYFAELVRSLKPEYLPLKSGQAIDGFLAEINPILFDQNIAPKRVNLNPDQDLVVTSAVNFYEGVTQKEAEDFYRNLRAQDAKNKKDTRVSYGLNSKVVKENGKITEKTWKQGGMYSEAIVKIIYWLEKAMTVAENPSQKEEIGKLIDYYKTGDLKTWDDYNILWVKDLDPMVDYVNGFIEVYGDPLAMKATWEAVVNFKNLEATKRTEMISQNAEYFERNSPIDEQYKKKEVKGISAKVITVAQLGGDCHPTTPIGINLPNAQWIRSEYGSKSVTMENITYAYDQVSQGSGFIEEFASSPEEIERCKKNGFIAGNLTTDMHECLGHASGQLETGVTPEALRNYHSAIEESRADLFALYYILDPAMIDLGLVTTEDVGKAEYDNYIRNGLITQLVRIKPGKQIEQAHMRDRSLICHWVYERGKANKVIEKVTRDGKTYVKINDYQALRMLFGELLKEVQRITSTGDLKAAKTLVETYGVKVDPELHKEVLERYAKLKIAPYSGFINPLFVPVMQDDTIADIEITYPDDFAGQMISYGKEYSFIPVRK
jgi:dipeptidyl-peptidase-3